MGIIYIIKVKNSPESKKTGYIGQDMRAKSGYYPRVFEHVLSGYDLITDGQDSDKFIGKVGAYKCDYLVFDETNSYGLDSNKFNIFQSTWKTSQPERAMLDWAEICWIYWYNRSYSSQNDEWGAQATLTLNLETLEKKLKDAGVSETFKDGILTAARNNPVTWSAKEDKTMDREHLYKLFYPEEFLIKEWIKGGLAEFLTDKNRFNNAFKAALEKWNGKVIEISSKVAEVNLSKFLKEELQAKFNPSTLQSDLTKLKQILGYTITFSVDQSVIDQLVNSLALVIKINADGSFSLKQSKKISTAVESIFKAHLGLNRKEYPNWLSRGQVMAGTSVEEVIKQSTVQYAWPQLTEGITSLTSGPDILTLQEKIPFIQNLVGTDELSDLNSLVQDIKQNSPIEPFGKEWQMFAADEGGERYIWFRRGAWSFGAKVKIDFKNYARIKALDKDSLASWKVW